MTNKRALITFTLFSLILSPFLGSMSSYAQNQFTLTGDRRLHYVPSEKPFDGRENARLDRLSYAFRKFLNEQATEDLSPDESQVLKDQKVANRSYGIKMRQFFMKLFSFLRQAR